ncbi:MAG: DNA polymerase III subunit gamma/tau [Candidatus Acetothermia bacterium]
MSRTGTGERSLYLRWRPGKFGEVIGQEGTVRILKNSVQRGETSHAYLFAGPRGTGKTSVARILAKALNCEDPREGEPCNSCSSCRKIEEGTALDIVEIDGASNRGIDKIRELREEVNFAPAELDNKVYIIDEVHMLTNQAFNALLKTIEEPPDKVTFIFATTEPEEVPSTIVSRCQVFEFKEISGEDIRERLKEVASVEGVKITDEALGLISDRARGSMRDGLVILEQVMASGAEGEIDREDLFELLGLVEGETTERYIDGLLGGRAGELLEILDDLTGRGRDLELFLEQVLEKLRARIRNSDEPRKVKSLVGLSRRLLDTSEDLKRSSHKQVALEIGTLELVDQFLGPEPAEAELTGDENRDRTESEEVLKEQEDVEGEEKGPEEVEARKGSSETDEEAKGSNLKNSERWRKMVERIEEDKISIAAFLEEAVPVIRNQDLYLEFSEEFSFHKESLETRRNLSYLKSVVDDFFDDIDELRIIYSEDNGESSETEGSGTSLLDEKSELVKKKFGGNVVEEGRI